MKNVPPPPITRGADVPPPLSKRAQRLLAKHLVHAITRAAEDPVIRDYVMASHFVLGWIESLAGHGVDTHRLFDLCRHNAPVGTLADERQLFLLRTDDEKPSDLPPGALRLVVERLEPEHDRVCCDCADCENWRRAQASHDDGCASGE